MRFVEPGSCCGGFGGLIAPCPAGREDAVMFWCLEDARYGAYCSGGLHLCGLGVGAEGDVHEDVEVGEGGAVAGCVGFW